MNGIRKDALEALIEAYAPLQRFVDMCEEELDIIGFTLSDKTILSVTEVIHKAVAYILNLDGYGDEYIDDAYDLVISGLEEGESADWFIGKAEDFIREHKEAKK